jgi:hypothetical protein
MEVKSKEKLISIVACGEKNEAKLQKRGKKHGKSSEKPEKFNKLPKKTASAATESLHAIDDDADADADDDDDDDEAEAKQAQRVRPLVQFPAYVRTTDTRARAKSEA